MIHRIISSFQGIPRLHHAGEEDTQIQLKSRKILSFVDKNLLLHWDNVQQASLTPRKITWSDGAEECTKWPSMSQQDYTFFQNETMLKKQYGA